MISEQRLESLGGSRTEEQTDKAKRDVGTQGEMGQEEGARRESLEEKLAQGTHTRSQ